MRKKPKKEREKEIGKEEQTNYSTESQENERKKKEKIFFPFLTWRWIIFQSGALPLLLDMTCAYDAGFWKVKGVMQGEIEATRQTKTGAGSKENQDKSIGLELAF
jgi:hypothetical protein